MDWKVPGIYPWIKLKESRWRTSPKHAWRWNTPLIETYSMIVCWGNSIALSSGRRLDRFCMILIQLPKLSPPEGLNFALWWLFSILHKKPTLVLPCPLDLSVAELQHQACSLETNDRLFTSLPWLLECLLLPTPSLCIRQCGTPTALPYARPPGGQIFAWCTSWIHTTLLLSCALPRSVCIVQIL